MSEPPVSLTLCVTGTVESADLGPAGRVAAFAEWVEDELPALAHGRLVRRLAGGSFDRAGGAALDALLADARHVAATVTDADVEAMVAYRDGSPVRDEDGEPVYWPAERPGSWFAATAGGERIGVHRGRGFAVWRQGTAARYITHAAGAEVPELMHDWMPPFDELRWEHVPAALHYGPLLAAFIDLAERALAVGAELVEC